MNRQDQLKEITDDLHSGVRDTVTGQTDAERDKIAAIIKSKQDEYYAELGKEKKKLGELYGDPESGAADIGPMLRDKGFELLSQFEQAAKNAITEGIQQSREVLTNTLSREVDNLVGKFQEKLGNGLIGQILMPMIRESFGAVTEDIQQKLKNIFVEIEPKFAEIPISRGERLGKTLPPLCQTGNLQKHLDLITAAEQKKGNGSFITTTGINLGPFANIPEIPIDLGSLSVNPAFNIINPDKFRVNPTGFGDGINETKKMEQMTIDGLTRKGQRKIQGIVNVRGNERVDYDRDQLNASVADFIASEKKRLDDLAQGGP